MSRYIPKAMKTEVRERARGRCEKCGKKYEPQLMEVDHITPYSIGGTSTLDNLQLLCRICNSKKGAQALRCVRCGEKNLHSAKFCQSCKTPIRKANRKEFGWIPRQGFDLRRFVLKVIGLLLIAYAIYLYLVQNR